MIYELFICWDIYIFCHMSIWKIMIIRVDIVYIHSKTIHLMLHDWLVSILWYETKYLFILTHIVLWYRLFFRVSRWFVFFQHMPKSGAMFGGEGDLWRDICDNDDNLMWVAYFNKHLKNLEWVVKATEIYRCKVKRIIKGLFKGCN